MRVKLLPLSLSLTGSAMLALVLDTLFGFILIMHRGFDHFRGCLHVYCCCGSTRPGVSTSTFGACSWVLSSTSLVFFSADALVAWLSARLVLLPGFWVHAATIKIKHSNADLVVLASVDYIEQEIHPEIIVPIFSYKTSNSPAMTLKKVQLVSVSGPCVCPFI